MCIIYKAFLGGRCLGCLAIKEKNEVGSRGNRHGLLETCLAACWKI